MIPTSLYQRCNNSYKNKKSPYKANPPSPAPGGKKRDAKDKLGSELGCPLILHGIKQQRSMRIRKMDSKDNALSEYLRQKKPDEVERLEPSWRTSHCMAYTTAKLRKWP